MRSWKILLAAVTAVAASPVNTLPPGHDFDFTVKFDNQELSTTSPPAPNQVLNLQSMTGNPEFRLYNMPQDHIEAHFITFMQIALPSVIFYRALRGDASLDEHGVLHQSSAKILAQKDYVQFEATQDMKSYNASIEVWRQSPVLDGYVEMAKNSSVMLPYAINRLPNEPSWMADPAFKYASIDFKVVFEPSKDSCSEQETTDGAKGCASPGRPESTPKHNGQEGTAICWKHMFLLFGACAVSVL